MVTAIATTEAGALAQLLGDTGEPRPADLAYTKPPSQAIRWRSDGGPDTGSLSTVAEYYGLLNRGRLVVLGEAGAGKTVLVLRLLLDLAAATLDSGHDDSAVKVPVRLSLPTFRTKETVNGEVRKELDKWIIAHFVKIYNADSATAAALVRKGWVIPILDGLDEMDPEDDQTGRSGQVLAALNIAVGPSLPPVVVTCRTARYSQLVDTGLSDAKPLEDATAITLQPLSANEIVDWIEYRFPHDADRARWRAVTSNIRSHPIGRLSRSLSSPLRLYLAVTVYRDPASRPKTLCDLRRRDLDHHILRQLLPAVVEHRSRPNGDRYAAEDVVRWFRTIASHLAIMGRQGRSSTDFQIEDLWRSIGNPPGWKIRIRAAVLAVLMLALPWALTDILLSVQAARLDIIAAVILQSLVIAYGATLAFFAPGRFLIRVDLSQLRTRQTRVRLWRNVKEGLLAGPFICAILLVPVLLAANKKDMPSLKIMLVEALAAVVVSIVGGVIIGPVLGLIAGLAASMKAIHGSAGTPSEPYRQAVRTMILFAIPIGFYVVIVDIAANHYAMAIVDALIAGPTLGFVASGAVGWYPHYLLALINKRRTNDLPRALMDFLDWGYAAGLLRMSGFATQFRHRELQSYLASETDETVTGQARVVPLTADRRGGSQDG
ncbi:NACHT domain-containing protein [Kribbella capetownensis]|uniref:NACHT domain-containing protein n=1 Tax=Kribbella capetownensis TaxID=1572659 RepID=UPI0013F48F1E|nr:NACHT domain-containing protein [Kribbella capetownensis]